MKLLKVLVTLALVLLTEIIVVHSQQRGDEICETLPSEIHLIKGTNKCVFAFKFY